MITFVVQPPFKAVGIKKCPPPEELLNQIRQAFIVAKNFPLNGKSIKPRCDEKQKKRLKPQQLQMHQPPKRVIAHRLRRNHSQIKRLISLNLQSLLEQVLQGKPRDTYFFSANACCCKVYNTCFLPTDNWLQNCFSQYSRSLFKWANRVHKYAKEKY